MSVQYITGNALDFPEGTNVLLHGCNTIGGVFGAGIAKQIAERYPAALEADIAAAAEGHNQLGQFSQATLEDGKRVVNLYIQDEVGPEVRRVNYEALYVGLSHIQQLMATAFNEGRIYSIAMPWIGCGLAGGSRRVVEAMVEQIFGTSQVMAYVVDRTP